MQCTEHPSVETELACGKCETPICPRCLYHTPVGARCRSCANIRRLPMYNLSAGHLLRGLGAALVSGTVLGVVLGELLIHGFDIARSVGHRWEIRRQHAALVIAAPKLKSGRAIQVITGPAKGQTFRSMTAAMEAATAHQRRQLGSGKSKKGLPSSGWKFWQAPEAARMSA